MMNIFTKSAFLLTLIFGLCNAANAQQLVGETNPIGGKMGLAYTYYYETPHMVLGAGWQITNGFSGTGDRGQDARGYWIKVRWQNATSGRLAFFSKYSGEIAALEVTIKSHSCVEGQISGPLNICEGSTATLTNKAFPSGGNGSFTYQWYYSPSGTGDWTVAPGTSTSASYTIPSSLSYADGYFKRKEISICGELWAKSYNDPASEIIKVVSQSTPTAGTLSGSTVFCGSGQVTLQYSGGDANSIKIWSKLAPGATVWETITPSGDSFSEPAIDGVGYKVTSHNSCGQISTKTIISRVYPSFNPGSITGSAFSCEGQPVTLSESTPPSGGDGNYSFLWQRSADGSSNWGNAPGDNNLRNYTTPQENATWYYRRKVIAICDSKFSTGNTETTTALKVNYVPPTTAGDISGQSAFCEGGQVQLSHSTDSQFDILNWQKKEPGQDWVNQGYASSVFTDQAVNGTAYRVMAGGTCGEVKYTKSIIIDVSDPSEAGSVEVPSGSFYNSRDNVPVSVSNYTGTIDSWQMKAINGNWQAVPNSAGQTSIDVDLTSTTAFKVSVSNGACAADYAEATVLVTQTDFEGEISGSDRITGVENNANLTLLNYSGSIAGWEYSTDGVDWIVINSTQVTIQHVIDPGVYYYRVKVVKNGTTGYSPIKTVTKYASGTATLNVAKNYNKVETIVVPVTNASSIENLDPLAGEKITEIVYKDGFGRALTSVTKHITPSFQDMVSHQTYSAGGTVKSYLPYAASGKMYYDGIYNVSTFYDNMGFNEQGHYYSTSVHEDAPGRRIIEQGAPGADWAVRAHSVKYEYGFNLAGEVRHWDENGISDTYYEANTLVVNTMIDENGNAVKTFTDLSGNTVLKQVEIDEIVEGEYRRYLETYYIYDVLGRPIYTLPPKAVIALGSGAGLNASNSAISELIFKYTYDVKGRLVEKKVPGAEAEYIIYDPMDRVVLTQDGNQRQSNQWMFVKYDELNRPVYSGIYTNTTETSRDTIQSLFDALDFEGSDAYYEVEEANESFHGYSNTVFPTTGLELLGVNYYDHYDFNRDGTPEYTEDQFNNKIYNLKLTKGVATGGKIRLLGTEEWLMTVGFIDNHGRTVEVRKDHHLGGVDKSIVQYDLLTDRVWKTSTAHYKTRNLDTEQPLEIRQRYEYDHAGRLVSLFQQNGSDQEQLVAHYSYNELGQQIGKDLHYKENENGGEYLQTVDYSYNIRGWLKAMNEPGVMNPHKLYGMEWIYNEDTGQEGQTPYYNGNISLIKWKEQQGKALTKSYSYTYDKADRLTDADNREGAADGFFSLNNVSYDANGNISGLTRYSNDNGAKTKIDELSYNYGTGNSNQLLSVSDATAHDKGFKGIGGASYIYDAVGNMTADANKGITSITYNILNKPDTITFDNGTVINYIYAASGEKLAQEVYKNNILKTRTDYIGNMLYENDTLRFFGHAEGRVVVDEFGFEYQYAYTDHLGNVRMIYTSEGDSYTFKATMESEDSLKVDDALFVNIDDTRTYDPTGATSHDEVARLSSVRPIGPGISLPVYPGDTVDMQVKAYHYGGDFSGSLDVTQIVSALAGAFGGTSGGGTEQAIFDNAINPANGGFGLLGNGTSTRPAAYLNYILFDKDFKAVQHGHSQISASGSLETLSLNGIIAQKQGWVYVYLSNESNSADEVYFDDLEVTLKESLVVQSNNYYPFGLVTSDSWTRPTDLKNNFLYNAGSELNEETGNYETFYRQYDAAIGRFTAVDVKAAKYASVTPYNYALNDPVGLNDPYGDDVWDNLWDRLKNIWYSTPNDGVGSWSASSGYHYYQPDGNGGYSEVGGYGSSYYDNPHTRNGTYTWKSNIFGNVSYKWKPNKSYSLNDIVQVETRSNVAIAIESEEKRQKYNLHDDEYDKGTYHVIIAKNFVVAQEKLNSYLRANKVDNLVIFAHGAPKSYGGGLVKTGGSNIKSLHIDNYMNGKGTADPEIQALQRMSDDINEGGNLVFSTCWGCYGEDGMKLGASILELTNNKVNVFLNMDYSDRTYNTRTGHVEIWTGKPLSPQLVNGWVQFVPYVGPLMLKNTPGMKGNLRLDTRKGMKAVSIE